MQVCPVDLLLLLLPWTTPQVRRELNRVGHHSRLCPLDGGLVYEDASDHPVMPGQPQKASQPLLALLNTPAQSALTICGQEARPVHFAMSPASFKGAADALLSIYCAFLCARIIAQEQHKPELGGACGCFGEGKKAGRNETNTGQMHLAGAQSKGPQRQPEHCRNWRRTPRQVEQLTLNSSKLRSYYLRPGLICCLFPCKMQSARYAMQHCNVLTYRLLLCWL